ncbi:MAG: hypothetical protein ACP5VE_12900 [Chthonomonadales bacterium]
MQLYIVDFKFRKNVSLARRERILASLRVGQPVSLPELLAGASWVQCTSMEEAEKRAAYLRTLAEVESASVAISCQGDAA